jgi:exodeoxyribonuclease-3
VRLATWNVNGLRARLELLLRWLRERQPDVVGLQELKLTDAQFPHDALEAAGYRAAVHGQKGWNGVAVLSRKPLEVAQRGLPGAEPAGARLLTARVEDLVFTTLYIPNGKHVGHPDFPAKLAWLDALAAHLRSVHHPARPGVVCGDFNVCPTALDSWNEAELHGSIFHSDDERARLQGLLSLGLVDLFRVRHPERRAFSWWDYRGGAFHKGEGLRIDLVLGTAPLAARVREVEIDREYRKKHEDLTASDHAPVYVDLD